jgi:adenosylmethionine-8-amino-7-oxononanoate aminotransferase
VTHEELIASEKRHGWHPFTQMQDWCAEDHEPLILVEGEGALLRDDQGREYIDGNSSIWTNLHGHRHLKINAAIRDQLERVAHTSFLGFTHEPAIRLSAELVSHWPEGTLTRVFFSDDGSTAIEVAIKMAAQFRQLTGEPERVSFIAFSNAYHGDTMGASSLGGVGIFHARFSEYQFPVRHVQSMEDLCALDPEIIRTTNAVVIEPLIQGAAGMRIWPTGMLADLRAWCDEHGIFLILDEVMTAFGRTGRMYACQHENVIPDFIAMAKGLTGGYMPLAATLTSERVFEAFLGRFESLRTFFYGHSFTANQLGCAAALANLAIFREENVLETLQSRIRNLTELLRSVRDLPNVSDVRQCGFIAGIDVCRIGGEPFDWRAQTGAKVCVAARKHGLLTRPIRDTVTLLPPYCITESQLTCAVDAIRLAVEDVCRH